MGNGFAEIDDNCIIEFFSFYLCHQVIVGGIKHIIEIVELGVMAFQHTLPPEMERTLLHYIMHLVFERFVQNFVHQFITCRFGIEAYQEFGNNKVPV
jgi:hypothetical protein